MSLEWDLTVSKGTKDLWLKIRSILITSQEVAVLDLLLLFDLIRLLARLELIQVAVLVNLLTAVEYGALSQLLVEHLDTAKSCTAHPLTLMDLLLIRRLTCITCSMLFKVKMRMTQMPSTSISSSRMSIATLTDQGS